MPLVSFIQYRCKGSARGSERIHRTERSGVGGASTKGLGRVPSEAGAALGSLHTGATLGWTGPSPAKVRDRQRHTGDSVLSTPCHHHLGGLSQPASHLEILNPTEKLQWIPVFLHSGSPMVNNSPNLLYISVVSFFFFSETFENLLQT